MTATLDGAPATGPATGPAVTAPPRRRVAPVDLVGPLVVLGLFLALWYWLSYRGMSEQKRFLVPPPHEVVEHSLFNATIRSELLSALWLTTKVAFGGLAIAIVIGVALATLMSQAKWIERSLYPYAVALQAIPVLAFVPLIGVLLDYRLSARLVVCVIIALFPIINNTLFGLLSAEQGPHDLFTLHRAPRRVRLWRLQFPAAMPAIFAGLRISAGLSVVGAVVGDFFFRRGDKGLGILIDQYRARLNYPEMYGAVVLTSLLGIAVFVSFGLLRRLVVGRWYQESRSL
jgi:NitT/TauT family transport system permease protein